MAKLADLLGKYLVEWPDGALYASQDYDGEIRFHYEDDLHRPSYMTLTEIAEDFVRQQFYPPPQAGVTQSKYLAARDRIATNQQATQEAREIIAHGEELPKRDSKLWKRAALAAFAGYCARPGMDAECAAEESMFAADAFMNAMEKHLSN